MKTWAVETYGGWVLFSVQAESHKKAVRAAYDHKKPLEGKIVKVRLIKDLAQEVSFYNHGIKCRGFSFSD